MRTALANPTPSTTTTTDPAHLHTQTQPGSPDADKREVTTTDYHTAVLGPWVEHITERHGAVRRVCILLCVFASCKGLVYGSGSTLCRTPFSPPSSSTTHPSTHHPTDPPPLRPRRLPPLPPRRLRLPPGGGPRSGRGGAVRRGGDGGGLGGGAGTFVFVRVFVSVHRGQRSA